MNSRYILPTFNGRVKEYQQPKGGFIPLRNFTVKKITPENDIQLLNKDENLYWKTLQPIIENLIRLEMGESLDTIFEPNIYSAIGVKLAVNLLLDGKHNFDLDNDKLYRLKTEAFLKITEPRGCEIDRVLSLISKLSGIHDNSTIIAVCMVSNYKPRFGSCVTDVYINSITGRRIVYFPHQALDFQGYDANLPDEITVRNIRMIVMRSLVFFKNCGVVLNRDITFEKEVSPLFNIVGARNFEPIDYFSTEKTLWSFKPVSSGVGENQALKMLMVYLIGTRLEYPNFENIESLGVVNPRTNKIYTLNIRDIPQNVISEVENNVISSF